MRDYLPFLLIFRSSYVRIMYSTVCTADCSHYHNVMLSIDQSVIVTFSRLHTYMYGGVCSNYRRVQSSLAERSSHDHCMYVNYCQRMYANYRGLHMMYYGGFKEKHDSSYPIQLTRAGSPFFQSMASKFAFSEPL